MQASRRGRLALLVLLACCCAGFIALGSWQVQRLHWKRALIARVDARVHAAPVPPPARTDWPRIGIERDEYRRLELRGTYLRGLDTQTQALTELGRLDEARAELRKVLRAGQPAALMDDAQRYYDGLAAQQP